MAARSRSKRARLLRHYAKPTGTEKERGRFRAFLLASLKHSLANDAARRLAQKRGREIVAPVDA